MFNCKYTSDYTMFFFHECILHYQWIHLVDFLPFYKGDSFSNFMFAFLYYVLSEQISTLKLRICSLLSLSIIFIQPNRNTKKCQTSYTVGRYHLMVFYFHMKTKTISIKGPSQEKKRHIQNILRACILAVFLQNRSIFLEYYQRILKYFTM